MSASRFSSNERMPPKKPFVAPGLRQSTPGSHAFTPAPENQPHGMTGCNIRYRVDDLMKGGREVVLVHRGQEYRLRITSTGKLILTK